MNKAKKSRGKPVATRRAAKPTHTDDDGTCTGAIHKTPPKEKVVDGDYVKEASESQENNVKGTADMKWICVGNIKRTGSSNVKEACHNTVKEKSDFDVKRRCNINVEKVVIDSGARGASDSSMKKTRGSKAKGIKKGDVKEVSISKEKGACGSDVTEVGESNVEGTCGGDVKEVGENTIEGAYGGGEKDIGDDKMKRFRGGNVKGVGDGNVNVTYNLIQHCQGFQLGENNQLNLTKDSHPDTCTTNPTTKNGYGILIVNDILKNYEHPMPLDDLNTKLYEKLHEVGLKSFKELAGWPLQDFLIKNKDMFDVYTSKQTKLVKMRGSKRKRETLLKNNDEIVSEKHTDAETVSTTNSSIINEQEVGMYEEAVSHFDTDLEIEPWIEVKKKRTKIKGGIPKKLPLDSSKSFDENKFRLLISKVEDRDTIFVPSVNYYKRNPTRFMQDIVSMWNTPGRDTSHIIIGVHCGKKVGIEEPLDDKVFHNLFESSHFTMKPFFQCLYVMYEMKLFGVIEISSSLGQGDPSIVKKSMHCDSEVVSLEEGQLWCRNGSRNVVCKPTENGYGQIFKWFNSHSTFNEGSGNATCSNTVNIGTNTHGIQSMNEENTGSGKQPVSSDLPVIGKTFNDFWESVKGFKKGHFVLVAGDVTNNSINMHAFGLIPWIGVYDFDVFSNTTGMLNAIQDCLEKWRHLRLTTWNEPAQNISEHGTLWCFMRGRREMAESRTDSRDGGIEDTNMWFKEVRKGLCSNCEKLANFIEDYTVLTVVVLWPQNENLVPFIHKFLDRLNEIMTCMPNIVLCLTQLPLLERARRRFETICEDFGSNIKVCCINRDILCHGVINHVSDDTGKEKQYSLPMLKDHESSPITDKDATWLWEDGEVLYLNDPYRKVSSESSDLQDEINLFYKGGSVPWSTWYQCGAEQFEIERDIMKTLEDTIKPHMEDFKTSIVTLFHAPGSGGTALAQRVLWKFHDKIPCMHVKLRTASSIDDMDRKVSFLHEKTDLPVLLLIDGEEESKVRLLSRRLKYAIILYVKRYPYKTPISITDKVFLAGTVSLSEAKRLVLKFSERCNGRQRKALKALCDDIQNKRAQHCLYEFGMTIYHHEFKGIVSYVEGYLQLDSTSSKELHAWQKCLGYLALVYYYGQTSVPCQFFASLLGKPSNYSMELEDFPHPIPDFVVYDKNEGRTNNLRICHYIVAKEILEQILSRHNNRTKERTDSLGLNACRNLSKFCIDFIEYAGKKRTKSSSLSTTIRFILTKTFIFRDEKDMSDNEEQVRRKPVLSKLMIDIPAGRPLFTERHHVLQKLSTSFPDDPNFCAHLGRFHAFCRPDEENEAEKCFRKSISLCEDQIKGKKEDEIDDGMKLTMMHIYHMYGIVKQRYVSKFTGRSLTDKVVTFDDEAIFYERMQELVPVAEVACEYFTKSRNITPETHDVYTYAYTGEIQVRLQICDFVKRYFRNKKGTKNSILEFLASDSDGSSKAFVRSSISAIENLIMECYMDVALGTDDCSSLRKLVLWYNGLFKKQVLRLESLPAGDEVSERRLKIAYKKLQFGSESNLSGIENIDDENEINEIISLYEENFNDILNNGFQGSSGKKELERDYRDWIFAIRHDKCKKNYSLEDVLIHLQNWHDQVRSPISTFYLFIVKSLLGFGTETIPGKTECLLDALSCKEELTKMNHLVIRPKYPREWLKSTGNGIKKLEPGNRHVGIPVDDKSVISTNRVDLAICKGTICYPNTNKVNGMIDFDLDVNTVKVYFIPKVVGLDGNRYVGQRVEFQLAFSIQHGYEAYNVKLLKRYGCWNCSAKLEIKSIDAYLICKCGQLIYKDDINEVERKIL